MSNKLLNTARMALQKGRFQEAEQASRRILAQDAQNQEALLILGQIALQASHYGPATSIFETLVGLSPNNADYLATLGSLNLANRNAQNAHMLFKQALSIKPTHSEALKGLGQLFLQSNDFNRAIDCLEKAEKKLKRDPDLLNALGAALAQANKPGKAALKFKVLTQLFPNDAKAWNNLGNAQQAAGELQKAASSYEKALKLAPNTLQPLYNLGALYSNLEEPDKALATLNKAKALAPDSPEIESAIGVALSQKGQHRQAIATIEQAVTKAPQSPALQENLGKAWQDFGIAKRACEAWDRAFDMQADLFAQNPKPILGTTPSSLFYSNCVEDWSAETLANKIRTWAGKVMDPWADMGAGFKGNPDPTRPLKIAFLSPDFREHSVRYFFLPLIENWNDKSVEIHCYAHIEKPDAQTKRVKKASQGWHDITSMSDREAAEKIRDDQIDIAIDLAGYSRNTRLGVLAYRPAPVQMTWLGYPNTTGMKAIDYRIVDEITDPVGLAEPLHSERLLRLDPSFLCYERPEAAPPVSPPPCLQNGFVTFCSFNNRLKINEATLDVWAKILRAVPNSKLLLKDPCFTHKESRDAVLKPFTAAGIKTDRIDLRERTKSKIDHFALYGEADIALDTSPYNGTTTTFEALWMGLPVITLAGDRHAARVGKTILENLGLTECVAQSWDNYIEKSINLANNTAALDQRRSRQREQLQQSVLMDGPHFAKAFADLLRGAWVEWCKAQNR